MSHILEEPELDKTGILQGAKREMSSEAVREWNNESNQTEFSAQPLSNAKVKNQNYKFIRGPQDSMKSSASAPKTTKSLAQEPTVDRMN